MTTSSGAENECTGVPPFVMLSSTATEPAAKPLNAGGVVLDVTDSVTPVTSTGVANVELVHATLAGGPLGAGRGCAPAELAETSVFDVTVVHPVAETGTTSADAEEDAPEPTAFVAATVKV